MRIGIEAQRLFRRHKHGMDMVALELIRALSRLDDGNTYIAFVRPDQDNTCLDGFKNVQVVELSAPSYPIWEQIALPRAARIHAVDLLHSTANTAPLFSPVPLVVTLHDVIYLEPRTRSGTNPNGYQKMGNAYRRMIVPRISRQSERIITVSEYEKRRISEVLALPPEGISVIPNSPASHFHPVSDVERRRARQQYKLPAAFLLFFGNTDPKKNMPGVLEAYGRAMDSDKLNLPLVMVDVDPSHLRTYLRQLDRDHLRSKIILPGYISNTDLPGIFSASTAFLYPSLRESFGIPILEAMATGTPVITSKTSSMPEVSGDAAWLVDPTDPDELADAIITLAHDKEQRLRYIERGFKRVARYSWDRSAGQLSRLYSALIQQKSSGSSSRHPSKQDGSQSMPLKQEALP